MENQNYISILIVVFKIVKNFCLNFCNEKLSLFHYLYSDYCHFVVVTTMPQPLHPPALLRCTPILVTYREHWNSPSTQSSIQWTEHVSSNKVLEKIKTKRKLILKIRKWQLKFLGHLTRKEDLKNLMLTR